MACADDQSGVPPLWCHCGRDGLVRQHKVWSRARARMSGAPVHRLQRHAATLPPQSIMSYAYASTRGAQSFGGRGGAPVERGATPVKREFQEPYVVRPEAVRTVHLDGLVRIGIAGRSLGPI